MKLYMKQKVFSWSDRFSIYDEQGNEIYYAEAELFSFGHRLHVYKHNVEIGYIQQKILTFLPKFTMELRGNALGEITKRFSLLSHQYDLDYKGWHVEGDFMALDYTAYDAQENEIMQVSKAFFSWGDSYCLNIHNPEDEEICVMILLAIDCAMCSN